MNRQDVETSGLRIRRRTDDDLAACVRMLRAVHERAGYPVNWPTDPTAWLEGESNAAWVALHDGTYAGHVAVLFEGCNALIERLFVDPDRSGMGAGRALLRRAAAEARTHQGDVLLDVVAAADAANALYLSDGWTEVSRTPIGWGTSPESMLIRYRAPGVWPG